MSVEILEAESDFFRHYDAGLEELASSIEVAALGPDLEEAALPNIEEAVRRFLADALVLEGHAKLRAQGVPNDVLPDESGRSRSLELDVLPEPDRKAFEAKLRDFAAQTMRDPQDGGDGGEGGKPGAPGPAPSPIPIKPIISASHSIGHSCIRAFSFVPGFRLEIPALPAPPPGRNFVTLGIIGWMPGPYGGGIPSGDGLRAVIDDGAPFPLQPTQMIVSLASSVSWAKEVVAWNVVRGRLSSVYQGDTNSVPTTMLLTRDCEGTDTILFRAPKAFGVWHDLFHFDPNTFWTRFGGRRLALTWTTQ
jgi:hypothetical protein